jgi:predicted RNase H-like HicB family nuclease
MLLWRLIIMIVKIEAYHDGEFWCARGIGEDIFTQGETFDELIENIKEAVALHFDEIEPLPDVLLISEVKLSNAVSATS